VELDNRQDAKDARNLRKIKKTWRPWRLGGSKKVALTLIKC